MRFRLRPLLGGSPPRPAEASTSSYGPPVRLRLLPTPPRSDAVTLHYGPMPYPDTDAHPAVCPPSGPHQRPGLRANRGAEGRPRARLWVSLLSARCPAGIRHKVKRPDSLESGRYCLKPGDDLLSHGETPHYHRRYVVSLLSSGRDQVVPTLYGRQANWLGRGFSLTRLRAALP